MSNFLTTTINLGDIKGATNHIADFIKTPNCKRIKNVEASCGCTTPQILQDKISTSYLSQTLEANEGLIYVEKRIVVTFADNSQDNLLITARIVI